MMNLLALCKPPPFRITDIKILLQEEETLRAFATITLDDCLIIRGIKVIPHDGKLTVKMPARSESGSFEDIAYAVYARFQYHITQKILSAYHSKVVAAYLVNQFHYSPDSKEDEGEANAGFFAKLKPPPPTLFGAARLKFRSEEEA